MGILFRAPAAEAGAQGDRHTRRSRRVVGPSADLPFTEEHDMATSRIVNLAAAAAMTGLIGGAALTSVGCHNESQPGASMGAAATAAHECKGMNACKGQGGCKAM